MEYVKLCVNPRGPLRKTKYYFMTYSELVPWGKDEKEPRERSEKEREIVIFVAVGELGEVLTICLLKNEPTTFWVKLD